MKAVSQNTDCLNARALFHGIVVSVSSSPTLLPLQNDADAASSIGGSRYNTHPPGPLRVSNCDWLPLALMVQPVLACSVFFIAFPCIPLRTSHLVTPRHTSVRNQLQIFVSGHCPNHNLIHVRILHHISIPLQRSAKKKQEGTTQSSQDFQFIPLLPKRDLIFMAAPPSGPAGLWGPWEETTSGTHSSTSRRFKTA